MSRAEQFPTLPAERLERWSAFGHWEEPYFPKLVGLHIEEIRDGYCRMQLPWRFELTQPAGVVHGGVIATLIDSVVVPAIGASYPEQMRYATVDLHVQYMGAVVKENMTAEGWITKKGRSTIFCEAEVATDRGGVVARGFMTYKVSPMA